MDVYILLKPGTDPGNLPMLMGEEFEVIGPDIADGWTICGAESVVLAAITALSSFDLVRRVVVL